MRRVHQTIELDQSLRQSRSVWLSLAVFAIPFAAAGAISFLLSIARIIESTDRFIAAPVATLWGILWGVLFVLLDVYLFRQTFEASKRLRQLREDPSAKVRPLPAPFQASLFGPYH